PCSGRSEPMKPRSRTAGDDHPPTTEAGSQPGGGEASDQPAGATGRERQAQSEWASLKKSRGGVGRDGDLEAESSDASHGAVDGGGFVALVKVVVAQVFVHGALGE